MKKTIILLIVLAVVIGGALTASILLKNKNNSEACDPVTDESGTCGINPNAGLANPAAVYCQEQGGTLEPVERNGGEDADCVLPNNVRCPQWDFYRGECG